jgi:hypothetical protein
VGPAARARLYVGLHPAQSGAAGVERGMNQNHSG